MPAKRYIVRLSVPERRELIQFVKTGPGVFSITVHEPISALFCADDVAIRRNRINYYSSTVLYQHKKMPQNRFRSGNQERPGTLSRLN